MLVLRAVFEYTSLYSRVYIGYYTLHALPKSNIKHLVNMVMNV